ncbi:MAG: HEAT repeat domain-containing protein [Pirellula sp.]
MKYIQRILVLGSCVFTSLTSFLCAQSVVPLQHRWEADPGFGNVWNINRDLRAKFLNVEDLRSEHASIRFEAAQTICQNHDRPGFRKPDQALQLLMEQLSNSSNSILVKRTMISAACLLDDGTNAQGIWQAAASDPGVAPLVESYLIRWKSTVSLDHWRKILADSQSSQADIERALDGLAQVGQEQDRQLCMQVLRSDQATPITRLAAARTLGILQPNGLTSLADEILRSQVSDKHMLVASLLAKHQADPAALELMQALMQQGTATSKRLAANSIAESYPDKALSVVGDWVKHPDDEIRLAALKLLVSQPSDSNTRLQASLLVDSDSVVRNKARVQLLDLAKNGFRDQVREHLGENLNGQVWQGIEQAIILAVELQDRERCQRFLELLDHPRPEVNMLAGWALMELANDPGIVQSVVPHAEKLTSQLEQGTVLAKQDIIRLSFLFEVFGRNRYEPVLSMLRKYIPKDNFKMGNLSRSSAIWAIGKIMKDQDDPKLRAQLAERIMDLSTRMPENYLVGYACLLALGEFGYTDSKTVVERYSTDGQDALNSAGRWAKAQIEKSAK